MEVGCYSLHLYCDIDNAEPSATEWPCKKGGHDFDEFPHEFMGRTRGECVREARRRGWLFKKDGRTICPAHSKKFPRHTDF